jgi:bifunctional non-homologous end joining protein LigD
LLYPRDGITKQDVADYFQAVAGAMLPALEGRPLALEHWNAGIHKPSWFHQSIKEDAAEPWMTIAETPARTSGKTVRHLVADSPAALQWLAQRSALTVHMWSSRVSSLESPDWIVFDLDPAKGKGIEQAIEAALVFRKLLETLELPSVPKTSGKRGIHLLVPLVPGYSHEDAVEFACRIAEAVSAKVPDFTVERALANRRGRLYVDCLQNGYGKTIVAPYSLRAIDGAPVSAPLEWSEITRKLDPSKFNLRTMPERLAKKGDLFRAALSGGVKLPRLR